MIADSVYQLVEKKPFNRITVRDILEESGLSRATFYRNFSDKYDAINWCFATRINNILRQSRNHSWKEKLIQIYTLYSQHHLYFERSLKVTGDNSLMKFMTDYSYEYYQRRYLKSAGKEKLTPREAYIIGYYCYGTVQITEKWLYSGRMESIEEMADLIYELTPDILKNVL